MNSNAAPWQKAAAKVAGAMHAQNDASAAKPGIAKSFSIQPQPNRLKVRGSAAFAAASSPAYVKVSNLLQLLARNLLQPLALMHRCACTTACLPTGAQSQAWITRAFCMSRIKQVHRI